MPLGAVRVAIRRDIQEQLLTRVRTTKTAGERRCPGCSQAMTRVLVPRGPQSVTLDVCYPCNSVWFDPREYEVLRVMYGRELAPVKRMLDHKWKWAFALMGVPVERDSAVMLQRPWLTWSLAALITMVSVWAWMNPSLMNLFCLVPSLAWRMGGLTLLTSFFLHGGFFHLFANMYFMIVFGDNVEDYLGKARYLVLLLTATLAGNFLHIAMDPYSGVPVVGASGGISGLIVFYGLQFPRARLLILTRWLLFYPIRFGAGVALLLWFFLQLLGAWQQLAGFSRVSSLAHLGGAAAGLLFWLVWKNRLGVSPKPAEAAVPAAPA
ncbi:MAG TPA: rhomboid family intramembrane serine protease [Candidatus Acidoferrales bacterium]|nr:rhomboid family intramembrane serine protease [Candidatus Acidoferrales bacterium]